MKNTARQYFQRIDKTKFLIASLDDEQDDRRYWLSRPATSRIGHIETLRIVNYGAKAASRLQRVFEVAELT